MSESPDKNLINNIKNNINLDQSLNKLYDLYSPVYYKIIHFHFSSGNDAEEKKKLIKECMYHIFFAAKEFDFKRNIKFSSYLGNKARWMCLNFFNKEKLKKRKLKEKYESQSKNIDDGLTHLIEGELLDKIKKEIKNESDFRVEKIFHMRYFGSASRKLVSWKEISDKMDMSIQGCINIHNKFINKIKLKKIL